MQKPQTNASQPADRRPVEVAPFEERSPAAEGRDRSMDPEEMTLEDWRAAEGSRPTLDDENADGLDAMDEDIQRQAEDPTFATPRR